MLNIIKDFAIAAVIIIINHFFYGVEDIISFDFVVAFIVKNKTLFFASGILGSAALLLFTSMEGLGFHKVTYGLSKLFVRLSQFFITFISILNLVFYASLQENFLRAGGYFALFALFLILGASCLTLHLIDFNYHTKNALVPVGAIAFMSILMVEYIWPMSGAF